uniref:Uncharacterized protein n=1 Tax=Anguilla anguilla TaxID=7936 RepID=A0A0E9SCB9_ANGAN
MFWISVRTMSCCYRVVS